MKKLLLLLLLAPFFSLSIPCYATSNSSQQSSSNNIIGTWDWVSPDKNESQFFTLKSDGTFQGQYVDRSGSEIYKKNYTGYWTRKNDKVYLTHNHESRVIVWEILSLDNYSLVVHVQGEPDDEIGYFKKR